jgi:hypothetical protein
MVELLLPVLTSLKRHLERLHSPLLGRLPAVFLALVRDFRVEWDDIMAANRQLAQEIEFDCRQYERQQQQQPAAAPVVASPRAEGSPMLSTPPADAAAIQRCVVVPPLIIG